MHSTPAPGGKIRIGEAQVPPRPLRAVHTNGHTRTADTSLGNSKGDITGEGTRKLLVYRAGDVTSIRLSCPLVWTGLDKYKLNDRDTF